NHARAVQSHATPMAEVDHWDDADAPDAERAYDVDLLARHLDQWVAEMPERRREAFLLSRMQGLSHEEIATVMDLTPRTVNTHIVLALKYLRQRLQTLEEVSPL